MWADQEFGLHLTEKGYGNAIGIGNGGWGGLLWGTQLLNQTTHIVPHVLIIHCGDVSCTNSFYYSKNGMR